MVELNIIAHCPYLSDEWLRWLSFYDISLNDVYLDIFELFTPDGDEEDFFLMFEQAFVRQGLISGSLDYIDEQIKAKELYMCIYEQVIRSTYYEFLIRSEIKGLYITGNTNSMILMLEIDV